MQQPQPPTYLQTYQTWCQALSGSPYAAELARLADSPEDLELAFSDYLSFGTAGMRGVLGLGPGRMNVFTVRRASLGLARHLLKQGTAAQGVVIAYDSRLQSDSFAKSAALTLAGAGVKAYLYPQLTSVPQLSFSVLQLGCAAGIVITASHNPAKYNGYKVYGAGGGQLASEASDQLSAEISMVTDIFGITELPEEEALATGLLELLDEELDNAYLAAVQGLADQALWQRAAGQQKVVYTALHGTGIRTVPPLLQRLGLPLQLVEEQARPDGHFPTVGTPNPEEPEAFTLAFAQAEACGAGLVLATDPDCDRLGAAIRAADGRLHLLSGNQIGCLLLQYLLESKSETRPADSFVVRSLVSTPLADAIASHHGVEMRVVLTGFKYIAEQINHSLQSGQGHFLFGFEESYGYLAGSFVRDKDACSAAMLLVEAMLYYGEKNLSLADVLAAMAVRFGCYEEKVLGFSCEGVSGMKTIATAMQTLRQQPPRSFAGQPVLALCDYASGQRYDYHSQSTEALSLPAADVLYFELAAGRVVLRPSGTEPKLKVYLISQAETKRAAQAGLSKLEQDLRQRLDSLLQQA